MPKIIEVIKKFSKAIPYLIIIALASMLALSKCSTDKNELDGNTEQLERAVNSERARVIELSNREEVLKERLKQDSLKNAKALIAYKRENTVLRKELTKARIPVQEIIDTIPSLDAFVDLQDSLIQHQEHRIEELTIENVTQKNNFNELLSVADQKFKASNELVTHYQKLNEDLYKMVNREIRRKTGFKILAGALAAGILYQSVTD